MSMLRKSGAGQKGFTLIEMSIVLVIIGLIIGGILKGQELINSSRQKNLITQVDGVRSAVNTFNDKFASLPGDFSLATTQLAPGAVNGIGQGYVGVNDTTATMLSDTAATLAGAANSTTNQAGENLNFWCQLAWAGLIGNSSTNCTAAATTFGNGSPLPSAAYPASGLDVVYGTWDTTATSNPVDTLWLRLHRSAGVALGTTSGAISAQDLFEIDTKYDDGTPGGGTIRSAGLEAAHCPNASATSVYSATSQTSDCAAFIQLVQ